MSAKQRRVTFDPELKSSFRAEPPPLPLAHYPAIVSASDIQDVCENTQFKSILKNPLNDCKEYYNLCNFLIDLPPPPSDDLLSFDILQETSFKPKNRFGQLKGADGKLPIFVYESSSSEESEEENTLPEIKSLEDIHNIVDIVNEDNLLFSETSLKPKGFEASLLLEQSADERRKYRHLNDLPEVDRIKLSCLDDTPESTSKADVIFSDITDLDSDQLQEEVVSIQILYENEGYLFEDLQACDELNICLDRRRTEDDNIIVSTTIPLTNTEKENVQNIRKLDDDHYELLDDFEIATKRNKLSYSSPSNSSSFEDQGSTPIIDTKDNAESIQLSTELDRIDSPIFSSSSITSITPNVAQDGEGIELQPINEDTFTRTSKTEVCNPYSEGDTPYEAPDLCSLEWSTNDVNTTVVETLSSGSLVFDTLSIESPLIEEPVSSPALLSISTATSNEKSTPQVSIDVSTTPAVNLNASCTSPDTLSPTEPHLTESVSSISTTGASSSPLPPINTSQTNIIDAGEAAAARRRRRSGRKAHRKSSHGSSRADSSATQTGVANITSTTTPPSDQEGTQQHSTLDAHTRFKIYLGKMSAKAMNENQNLNCAGEEETLEPHMRDSIKESQILIWIYNMIDEAARVDFEFFLKDGCIMCKLMNRVVPGCIPESEITWEGARSKQKNIANFLREAEKYGVPKAKLFFPEDLLHLRHVPRVTRCIYALAKIAQADPALGPEMPQLGDEPSFLKETHKVVVPGHRDTKDVLAQLTASKEDSSKKLTKHSLYQ